MANKDFAYCWIVRLRWTEYPVCTTIFEDARVAAYRIHKAVGFRETGTLDRIIHLELTREDYLKGISVCCDK